MARFDAFFKPHGPKLKVNGHQSGVCEQTAIKFEPKMVETLPQSSQ